MRSIKLATPISFKADAKYGNYIFHTVPDGHWASRARCFEKALFEARFNVALEHDVHPYSVLVERLEFGGTEGDLKANVVIGTDSSTISFDDYSDQYPCAAKNVNQHLLNCVMRAFKHHYGIFVEPKKHLTAIDFRYMDADRYMNA